MQRWKSENDKEWEEVRPLGSGGQSDVFLVRSPSRVEERKRHLETIMRLAGQGFDESRAREFSDAVTGYGREELPSELGALKIYKPRAPGDAAEAQALERLTIEIAALYEKGRNGLLKVLDFNKRERWIATEYHPRGTIKDNLPIFTGNALLSLASFCSLVEIVASLHEDGIIHRDIKPDNVYMTADGHLVLGDLGIALPHGSPARVTRPDETVGPWEYRPPWAEMVGRLDDVGGSFDVYMLGKLLWCMVSGNLLLPREWYDRPQYDLTKLFPTDPRMHAINSILQKCLQDSPGKCLSSAGELLAAVKPLLNAMQRGGQLLRDDVPRPCRVCGIGFYRSNDSSTRLPGTAALLHWVTRKEGQSYVQTHADEGTTFAQLLICDKCGHVQLFKVK